MVHDLKSWPANFEPLMKGRKFEVRRNDRGFALGDFVHLVEYLPKRHELTGRSLDFRVDDLIPFVLPGEPLEGVRYVILHYTPIVEREVTHEVLPPVRRDETPILELWAVVKQTTRVMQIVEDERGEAHQLFGTGMDPEAAPGTAGKFKLYAAGAQRFSRVECAHVFEGLICTQCGMPHSMAGR